MCRRKKKEQRIHGGSASSATRCSSMARLSQPLLPHQKHKTVGFSYLHRTRFLFLICIESEEEKRKEKSTKHFPHASWKYTPSPIDCWLPKYVIFAKFLMCLHGCQNSWNNSSFFLNSPKFQPRLSKSQCTPSICSRPHCLPNSQNTPFTFPGALSP